MESLPDRAVSRRTFVRSSIGVLALGASGIAAACGESEGPSAGAKGPAGKGTTPASFQLDWVVDSTYSGEVVALEKGFYRDRGIDLNIKPGGPNLDSVRVTASRGADIGSVSSNPRLFLARSSGIPLKGFGAALQRHPYAFFVKSGSGITGPQDFVGKEIAIPKTAQPLVDAVIKLHDLPADQIKITTVGQGGPTLLRAGKVDIYGSWATAYGEIEQAGGKDAIDVLPLWDMGVKFYGYIYFATDKLIAEKPEMLAAFLDASGLGWQWAAQNPKEAVDIVLKHGKELDPAFELAQLNGIVDYLYSSATKAQGWGWMDSKIWTEGINLYSDLGLLEKRVAAEDVMTDSILKLATERPKQ